MVGKFIPVDLLLLYLKLFKKNHQEFLPEKAIPPFTFSKMCLHVILST
jgi:hypothetical protein